MLHRGELHKSVRFTDYTYIGDPLIAVKIFNQKQAEEVCIVDVDPSRYGKPILFELLEEIAGECFMPLSYGGGIKSIEDARRILYSGFEKIVINSAIHTEGMDFIKELVNEFGSSTIILNIDYKEINNERYVFSKGGQFNTGKKLPDFIEQIKGLGIGELLLNSIDRDGTMEGLDIHAIDQVAKTIQFPLIACGGTGSLEDIAKGFRFGANAIAAGSLFVYKGPLKAVLINYPDQSVTLKIRQTYEDL